MRGNLQNVGNVCVFWVEKALISVGNVCVEIVFIHRFKATWRVGNVCVIVKKPTLDFGIVDSEEFSPGFRGLAPTYIGAKLLVSQRLAQTGICVGNVCVSIWHMRLTYP
jgi:hypothetical protein